jgi:hypothetical protein
MAQQLTRESVRARLEATRAELRALVAHHGDELAARRVTPEWNALDLLRHMWAWDELGARCLANWAGDLSWMPAYDDEDRFNAEMVAAHADADLTRVVAGIEPAHARFAETLDRCSDAELAEVAAAPWGERVSRLHMIEELLKHDQEHMEQIRTVVSFGEGEASPTPPPPASDQV